MQEVESTDAPPVKPPRHAREHLWSAAFWSGAKYAEAIVDALRNSLRPWYPELAPLTVEERVLVIAALCQQVFPDMTPEQRAEAYVMLGRLYGLKTDKKRGRHAH